MKKDNPSPFTYKPEHVRSRRGIFKSKLDRDGFIEDAKARSNDSPPPYNSKFLLVYPRLKGRSFYPTKKDNLAPIKKKDGPDWRTYTIDKAYSKTIKRIKFTSFSKYNLPLIQDLQVNKKKWVPGAGTYQWEKSLERWTKYPLFKKGKY